MKLVVIIDKSESYIGFEKTNTLKKWNVNEADTETVSSFSRVGEETIFGDASTAVMSVNSLEQWKKLFNDVSTAIKEGTLEKKVSQGLIITSTLARNSTKKLEELIKNNGGEVICAKSNAKDKTNVSLKMLGKLKLSKPVKDFLVDYAADDYDSLVSIIQSVSELPETAQSKISIEDLYIRLPKPPGSIPPWEIEKPLFSGDVNKTIEIFRRIISHSHFLVVLSILKTKISLSWKISALLQDNPRISEASAAEALQQAKNYPFKLAYESAKKHGFDKLTSILNIIAETEGKVKGGSSADGTTVVEIALINIANKLKK